MCLLLSPVLAAAQPLEYSVRESLLLPTGARMVAARDLDGDAALDVVLFQKAATSTHNPRMWVVEREGASFVTRFTVTDASQMRLGLVSDLDGDGWPELVTGHLSDNTLRIWEAVADNAYVQKYSQSIGYKITSSGVGDADLDGWPELCVGQEPAAHLHVLEAAGNDAYVYQGYLDGIGGNLTLAGIQDINGNGWPEVVFSDDSYSTAIERLHVFENGVEVYADPDLGLATRSLADTDGNGLMEIIGEQSDGSLLRVVENIAPAGGYDFVEVYSGAEGYSHRLVDVEDDGQPEFWRALDDGSGERSVFAIGRRSGAVITDFYDSGDLLDPWPGDVRILSTIADTNGDGGRELAVLQGDWLHFLEVGEPTPQFECVGFETPMDAGPVTVRRNRALPFLARLVDGDGQVITDADLPAPPVVQIWYAYGTPAAEDVTSEALPVNASTDGNQFFFDGVLKWHYHLRAANHSAPGIYTVMMDSGAPTEYLVEPTCSGQFVIR